MPANRIDTGLPPVDAVTRSAAADKSGPRPAPCCIPGQIHNRALPYRDCPMKQGCDGGYAAPLLGKLQQMVLSSSQPSETMGLLYALLNGHLQLAQSCCLMRGDKG